MRRSLAASRAGQRIAVPTAVARQTDDDQANRGCGGLRVFCRSSGDASSSRHRWTCVSVLSWEANGRRPPRSARRRLNRYLPWSPPSIRSRPSRSGRALRSGGDNRPGNAIRSHVASDFAGTSRKSTSMGRGSVREAWNESRASTTASARSRCPAATRSAALARSYWTDQPETRRTACPASS